MVLVDELAAEPALQRDGDEPEHVERHREREVGRRGADRPTRPHARREEDENGDADEQVDERGAMRARLVRDGCEVDDARHHRGHGRDDAEHRDPDADGPEREVVEVRVEHVEDDEQREERDGEHHEHRVHRMARDAGVGAHGRRTTPEHAYARRLAHAPNVSTRS